MKEALEKRLREQKEKNAKLEAKQTKVSVNLCSA